MTAPTSGSILTTGPSATICILDAGPMLAYLFGEKGEKIVRDTLADTTNTCYAHAVNLTEVFYVMLRQRGEQAAEAAIAALKADGITVQEDMDTAFIKDLAKLKARGNISLADCCCLALATRLQGVVMTTDHAEFAPLAALGIYPIYFIRPTKTKSMSDQGRS